MKNIIVENPANLPTISWEILKKEYEPNALKDKKNRDVGDLKTSILTLGFKIPFIIWEEGKYIADGAGRFLALEILQYEGYNIPDLPYIPVKAKNKKEAKQLSMVISSQYGEITQDSLGEFTLDMGDIDLGFINIPNINLSDTKTEYEVIEDDIPEVPKEAKSKLGDIYELGRHRLMCGDSTKEEDMKKLVGGEQIRCVFTSPPYNMNNNMYENYDDNLESSEYIDFNLKVVKNIKKHLNGFLFWNISYNKNQRSEFLTIATEISKILNFKEMIIWNKKKAMPIRSNEIMTRTYEDIFLYDNIEDNDFEIINLYENKRGLLYNKKKNKIIKNYWEINVTNNTQLENHKACFPVNLPAEGIKLTTEKEQTVYDPFGGSGSTLIACEQLNRNCYMMELDPKYIDVIIERWENFTGKKAKKINN